MNQILITALRPTTLFVRVVLALALVLVGCQSENTRGREALVRLEGSFASVVAENGVQSDDATLRSWRGAVGEVDKSGASPADVLAWATAWTQHMETSLAFVKKSEALRSELERDRQRSKRELQDLVDKGPDDPDRFRTNEAERASRVNLEGKKAALDRELQDIRAARQRLFAQLDQLRVKYGWEPGPAVLDAIRHHVSAP